MRRALPAVALVAAIAGLLYWVAVAGAEPVQNAPVESDRLHGVPQGHVYASAVEEPVSLNPLVESAPGVVGGVFRYTFDGLLDWDPATGALRGAAAERWEVGTDGRTVRFAIRDGLRFANGDPVSAQDLTFCWDYALAHEGQVRSSRLGAVLEQVRTVRFEGPVPGVLEIVLAAPGPRTLGLVGSGYWILQRSQFEEFAGVPLEDPSFGQRLESYRDVAIGTGPYQVAPGSWRPGEDLLLTRNPHAWHREARPGTWNFAGLRWRFPSALGELELAFVDEVLDVLPVLGRGLLANPEIDAHYRYLEYAHPLVQPYRVEWNVRRGPLADVRVRRALELLTDRVGLVAQALGGAGEPATGPFAPGHPGTVPYAPRDDDWERALALLAEAGYGEERPLEIELLMPSEQPLYANVAAFLADAWRPAGVVVQIETLEFSAFSARRRDRQFDGAVTMNQDPVPVRDLYPELHSSQDQGMNACGYRSEAADAALEDARTALDDDGRREAEARLAEILARDQPVLWLFHRRIGVLLHRRIEGAEVGAMGLSPERLWVEPENQRER